MRDSPPSSRIVGIQALRGIAACAVVLSHMSGVEAKYLAGPTMLPALSRFGMVGVDLFFVLSGFIMTSMSVGKFGRGGEASRFLTRRFLRIYPVYWAWCLPILAVFLMFPGMVNSSHGRPDLLRSFLLLPQHNLPLLLVAWTLVYEVFFYLVFAGALRWIRESRLAEVLCLWAIVVIGGHWWLMPGSTDPLLSLMFSPLLLEFMMGCAVALCVSRLNGRTAVAALALGAAGFLLGTVVFAAQGAWFPSDWHRTLVYGTSSAAVLAGVVAWERERGRTILHRLSGLGDASYSLYLSHVPVMGMAGLLIHHLLPTARPAVHVAALLLTYAAALAGGFLSFRLLEAPMLRRSRDLRLDAAVAKVLSARPRMVALRRLAANWS